MSHRKLASGLVAVAGVLGGCGRTSSRLEGHWHGVRAEGVPTGAQAAADSFATGTEMDVKGDSIAVTTPKERQSGHFKVIREDPGTVVIATDKDGPGEPQTFTFVDASTMKWAVIDGSSIVFVRP
jgi:hypothetical protein